MTQDIGTIYINFPGMFFFFWLLFLFFIFCFVLYCFLYVKTLVQLNSGGLYAPCMYSDMYSHHIDWELLPC